MATWNRRVHGVTMQRTYLALAGLALAGAALLPSATALAPARAQSASLFASRPVDAERFALLARPVARNDWNLLVLEQLQAQPLCWERRPDGLIDPTLNRFDFTGICSRYLDSNGYSLRLAGQDLATRYRLRVVQQGNELQLQAFSPNDTTVLVMGRGPLPGRDRDAFVALQLDPGWALERRAFGEQQLNHLYIANGSSLEQLHARASGGRPSRQPMTASRRLVRPEPLMPPEPSGPATIPGRTVALQVIPFQAGSTP
jgi:hypothetical protein